MAYTVSRFCKRLCVPSKNSCPFVFVKERQNKEKALILVSAYLPTCSVFWNGVKIWSSEWKKGLRCWGEKKITLLPISDPCSLLTQAIVPISPLLIPHTKHGKLGKCRQRPYCDELTHRFWVEDKREKNNGTMNPHFLKTPKGPGKRKFSGKKTFKFKNGTLHIGN